MTEKVFKQEDGSKVKVRVLPPNYGGDKDFTVFVSTCAKGKRKFNSVHDTNCHRWRALSMEERVLAHKAKALEYTNREQVMEVINLHLEENKPQFDNIRWN